MKHSTRYIAGGAVRYAPVADGTSFDGHLLSEYNIVVEKIVDRLPDVREELAENNGRHGSSVRSLRMMPRDISLECRLFTSMVTVADKDGDMGDWYDYDGAMSFVASCLYTDTDRELVLRNHPGQYYMAHFKSVDEGDRDDQSAGFTLNFVASDPLRYETYERVLVVQRSTTAQFDVGGSDEAKLRIEVSGVSNSRAFVYMYHQETGSKYALALYGKADTSVVTYDCVNHVATLGTYGAEDARRTGLYMGSQWPVLMPGRWTVQSESGTATLTWRQSWR